jgi:CDGSH-type Zn-finger protein
MAELAKSLRDLAFDALMADVCLCGSRKQKNKPFCFGCFKELPQHLKSNMWRGLRDGLG